MAGKFPHNKVKILKKLNLGSARKSFIATDIVAAIADGSQRELISLKPLQLNFQQAPDASTRNARRLIHLSRGYQK